MLRSRLTAAAGAVSLTVLLAACSSHADSPDSTGSSASPAVSSTAADSAMPAEGMDAAAGDADAHGDDHEGDGHDHSGHASSGGGLSASEHDLTLQPTVTEFPSGMPVPVEFAILGEDGSPITEFETVHEETMHLLLVRKDLTNYVHVHPVMAADGTWSIDVPGLPDGQYRLIADFTPTVHPMNMVLGTDLTVGSGETPAPDVQEARTATLDGYTAELVGDTAHEGKSALKVVLTGPDGDPVTSVNPYLGAAAHFVAFSDADLSVTHMHPNSETPDADGALTFTAPALDHAMYRGFVQVDIDGVLRTFELSWKGE